MKKFISAAITIAIIIGARFVATWLTAPKCEVCNESLTNKTYQADGKTYCNDCKPKGLYIPNK